MFLTMACDHSWSPRFMSQVMPALVSTAPPRATRSPVRALVAVVWLPFAVAMAQVMPEISMVRTAVTRTNVSRAPITVWRVVLSPRALKSG